MSSEAAEILDAEELRDAAVRLLTDHVDRRAPWDGRDSGAKALEGTMTELGWYLLTVPEDLGGLGQSFNALAPIYEELGRALAPVWLSGTMAALDVLLADGSSIAMATVRGIIEDGQRVATIIMPPGPAPGSVLLPEVPGADVADHYLLVPEDGSGALLISATDPGVSVRRVDNWDRGRSYADVRVEHAAGSRLTLDPKRALDLARAHLELALAWDCIGGADQCLAETIQYMQGREQFGRPIASFQALKHRAADHKVALELARSLVRHASEIFAARGPNWGVLATQARLLATEAFRAVAEDAVQLHGGVGFTWEYDCHLFLKRALVNEIIGGTPDQLRDRIVPSVVEMEIHTNS